MSLTTSRMRCEAPSNPVKPLRQCPKLLTRRAKSHHDQITEILGTEILKGIHRPGDNMPSVPALIRRFRVSRTVMREVTKTLAGKGFVVSKTKIGTRVRDPAHWDFFDADVLVWRVRIGLDDQFMRSLTEIRRALEPAAAALAAQRRTTADIARLRQHLSEMARAGHRRRSLTETELAFHLTIGTASGNPLMRSVATVIEVALASAVSYGSSLDNAARRNGRVQTYSVIVNAIEAGNAPTAAQAMLEVIDIGMRRIENARKKRRVKRRITTALCSGRTREEISC